MLLRLRNLLAIGLLDGEPADQGFAEPRLRVAAAGCSAPGARAGALTPALLRAGILRDGCVLVRGLIDRPRAERLRQADRSLLQGARPPRRRQVVQRSPVRPVRARSPPRRAAVLREWIKAGGGVLAVDSPMLSFELGELYREAGLPRARRAATCASRRSSPGTRRRCARPTRRSAGPGTRTASSWARSKRSTCGWRCRTAARTPRGSTSCRVGSSITSTRRPTRR